MKKIHLNYHIIALTICTFIGASSNDGRISVGLGVLGVLLYASMIINEKKEKANNN